MCHPRLRGDALPLFPMQRLGAIKSRGLFKPLSSTDLVETCNAIETLCGVQVGTLGPYLQRLAVVMIGGRPVTFTCTHGKSAVGNRSFSDFECRALL